MNAIADHAGISIGLLSQIERGLSSPSLRVIARLAHTLDLELRELLADAATDAESA